MRENLNWRQALRLWRNKNRGMVEVPTVTLWLVAYLAAQAAIQVAVELVVVKVCRWFSRKRG